MNAIRNISKWMSIKRISFITDILFFVAMLPNCFLAFIARPTGDDYGYAVATHQAWINTHSMIEVIKAGLETTKLMCSIWNGDWFSVFIFTFMPEAFVYGSFWIVPIFWTLMMIVATYYMAHEVLSDFLGLKWYESGVVVVLLLTMFYQWIPSSGIGMYWYVGVIHYIMPHVIAMLLIGFLFKFIRTYKFRYIMFSALGMIAIGGSSYYSAFLVLLSYFLLLVCCLWKQKRVGWFFVPIITGGMALYFQMIAPGNAARVGDKFEFTVAKGVTTIIEALRRGMETIVGYGKDIPMILVIFFLIAIFLWECLSELDLKYEFKYPVLWVGYMFGIHASMFTPEVYTTTDIAAGISGGPPTMEYLTFLLTTISSIIYVEGWGIQKLREKNKLKKREQYHAFLTMPAMLVCMVLCLCFKGDFKQTLFYESCEYIASGQAADFRRQMQSQEEILLNDAIKEAYLCPTNPEQGPLMHMPVIKNPNAFTNEVVAKFYGKEFVTTTE